jgi:light-regulated signal transduction histidine kinase (bacteriophytochrome)
MSDTTNHPAFGAADLSNCERELIHLAGSVQPHGALLVLREPDFVVVQASLNTGAVLGIDHARLLHQSFAILGDDAADAIARTAGTDDLSTPTPFRCRIDGDDGGRVLHGMLHRQPHSGLVVELERVTTTAAAGDAAVEVAGDGVPQALATTIQRISAAATLAVMGDEVVRCVRELTGYDRVMLYRFDADGHGAVIAEARDERLDPLLGQHYPASDIPQRARQLYLRTRVRALVDVDYAPVPIVPRHGGAGGVADEELDMSLCFLRSMSPLHLQYLRNMGVTATLVTSIVCEGRLWGLLACHHYAVKQVPYALRASCELLSEVVSTRITALESRAHVEAELFVRDLEQRMVLAATETGDWRSALFDDPEARLLRPLGASGVVLCYEGQLLTAGEVPSPLALRDLVAWLHIEMRTHVRDGVLESTSLPKLDPELATLGPTATGLLAVELGHDDGDYLLWFRQEQVRTVTWGGDPEKAVVVGDDPRELSPRRSFAAWRQVVRDTAKAWSRTERAIADAIRQSLVDMILQMRALRALIAEQQAMSALAVVQHGAEPMILASGDGHVLLANDAFHRMLERPTPPLAQLDDLLRLALDDTPLREALHRMRVDRQPWRGEMRLTRGTGQELPVAVRADPVPGLHGGMLGYILLFTDLRAHREAGAVRSRLERVLTTSRPQVQADGMTAGVTEQFNRLLGAILTNSTVAMAQLTDGSHTATTGELLRELEATTRRAAALTAQLLDAVSRDREVPEEHPRTTNLPAS